MQYYEVRTHDEDGWPLSYVTLATKSEGTYARIQVRALRAEMARIDRSPCVTAARVDADGRSVRLVIDGNGRERFGLPDED